MCIYIEIQIDDATIKKKRMIEKEKIQPSLLPTDGGMTLISASVN